RFSRSVNWFTQRGGANVIGIGYARSCAPILFGGSAAHGGDHPDSRTGFRDFGGVPHRMIFQEAQTDHEFAPRSRTVNSRQLQATALELAFVMDAKLRWSARLSEYRTVWPPA